MLVVLCAVTACSRPTPEEVVTAMLDDVADKRYTRALRFCGPRVWETYSNNVPLTEIHARMCDETTYTVLPGVVTDDLAYVRCEVSFDMRGDRVYVIPVRFDLVYDGRWLVDDAWRTGPDGRVGRNMLDHLPSTIY